MTMNLFKEKINQVISADIPIMAQKQQRWMVVSEIGNVDQQDFRTNISYMSDQVSPKCNRILKKAVPSQGSCIKN